MTDILTITLNPSLDLSAVTESVVAGPKLRLTEPVAEPGGGGVNVARAAVAMGARARAVACLGGATGARVRQLLDGYGVSVATFRLNGETRQSLAVTAGDTGEQFRFVTPGPQWSTFQEAELLQRVSDDARRMGEEAVVVLSGSQPPGVNADFPQLLVRALPNARLVVDTSGAALRRLFEAPELGAAPYVLRMDRAESEALAGRDLPDAKASIAFAQRLVGRGVAHCVVMARGGEGSILVTSEGAFSCTPPKVSVVSAIGAGDSFTAGLAVAMAQGKGWAEALRLGTAAATAAVMTEGSQLCRGEDVARLFDACHLSQPRA